MRGDDGAEILSHPARILERQRGRARWPVSYRRRFFSLFFGTSTNAFGDINQWHKHELEGRVDMPAEREEHLLYIGLKGRATFFLCGYILMHSCNVHCCDCKVFVCIWVHPEKLWATGFQSHWHDFEGSVDMPSGREVSGQFLWGRRCFLLLGCALFFALRRRSRKVMICALANGNVRIMGLGRHIR